MRMVKHMVFEIVGSKSFILQGRCPNALKPLQNGEIISYWYLQHLINIDANVHGTTHGIAKGEF